MILLTVRLPPGASLQDAVARLKLDPEEVDTAYGLVLIDPDQGLYGLRVSEKAWREGAFSDPAIEPYGPPEDDGR
ncbi:hypothetical protein [Thermoactinospora rubra]|uniref:hypothetical protein n=1 Tax=Thermoactinospora rubra TaxID=1088767 RepID=UPI000A10F78B|nr:hypothetical protein [Thermoactinospora rubra]